MGLQTVRHDLATEQHQQPWGRRSQCQRLHFSKCHSHSSVFWHEPLASGIMASIKDATLPVMMTHHNDTRRHFAREIQQSPPGRNDLPEADSRKPVRQTLAIPPTPDTSWICLFPRCPWVGFLCHISLSTFWPPPCAERPSRREPQHTLSESWEDVCVRLGSNEDFFADPRLGTDCMWEEMFSWCLLKMLFPSSEFQEGNEWGLPELHSSWNKSLN